MLVRQRGQAALAVGAQPKPNDAVVAVVGDPVDQARSKGAADEFDRAVMTKQKVRSDIADRRRLDRRVEIGVRRVTVTADREEQLVLGGGQAN